MKKQSVQNFSSEVKSCINRIDLNKMMNHTSEMEEKDYAYVLFIIQKMMFEFNVDGEMVTSYLKCFKRSEKNIDKEYPFSII